MKSDVGVFTTDSKLVVLTWDDWLTNVTSRPASDVCGRPLTQVFPEIEQRGLVAAFRRVLEDGAVELLAPALHSYLIACPPQQKPSRFQHMQQKTLIAPLRDHEIVVGLLVTIEDVTARRDDEMRDIESLQDGQWQARRQALDRMMAQPSETAISELVKRLRERHRDPNVLNSILPLLGSGAWDAFEPMVTLTRDADAELRMYTVLALGNLRDPRAVPVLVRSLQDPDVNVRYHAIEALAKLRASEATVPLMEIAKSGELFLAFAAIEALSTIGEPSLAPSLLPLLENEILRDAAIRALSQLGDDAVVPSLASLMDRSALVPSIAEALTTLHRRYRDQFAAGEHVVELASRCISAVGIQNLIAALHSSTGDTLQRIVRVLGWTGCESEAAIVELTRLLGSSTVRSEVIEALARHGGRVTAAVCRQLDSDDPDTRRAAVAALGRIADRSTVAALIAVLDDPELVVDAAGALAKIGDRQAYESLLGLLAQDRPAVRHAAIGALNSLGDPRTREDIRVRLTDSNPHVRESAVRIATYLGYDDCASLLLERINDSDESVRRAIIENLASVEDDRVFSILQKAVRDNSPIIRAAAVQALGQLEMAAAFPELLHALADLDSWVRYYAVRALGHTRNSEFIGALANCLQQDAAPHVKIAAADALGLIGGKGALAVLAPFVTAEDPDLARAALRSVGMLETPEGLDPILGALHSGDPLRRLDAVRAIASRKDSQVPELLTWTAAADENEKVRSEAITALSRIATVESIGALLRLCADRRLRETSVVALSLLGSKHVHAIAQGLSSPQLETRKAVVDALARMPHAEAAEVLTAALDNDRPEVRMAALTVLRRPGLRIPERKVWSMAQGDPDPGVRKAAEHTLQR